MDSTVQATLVMQAADRYVRVPFEVPEGAISFEVSLTVPEVDGVVVDLGCEGPTAWCGYSGGARQSFVVTMDDATPGYLPGVRPGTWHVVLGLHTMPPGGVELLVDVSVPARRRPDHGPVEAPEARQWRGSARSLPAPPGMRWFAGDTHAHSLHSDGALSLSELANEGVRSRLDFLCVTDHNTTSHHRFLPELSERHGITLVPGQEVTTHAGHANAYGEIGFVDFRRPAQEWVDVVAERGGIMSINHPVSGDCSWLHHVEREPVGVELYHGSWYLNPIDTGPLAWFQRWNRNAVLLGGGDFHDRSTPLRPGMPTTWVLAEDNSSEAILDAIRAGRTTITGSVSLVDGAGRPVLQECPILIRQGESLLVMAATGLVLVAGDNRRHVVAAEGESVAAPLDRGPYRLENADRMTLALCR